LVKVMGILSTQDRVHIEAAIARVEQRSAAEIVVAEIPSSDRYLDVRGALAGLLALGASAGLHQLLPLVGTGEVLALELLLFTLAFLLFGSPALLGRCLPAKRVQEAVQRAAGLSFLAHGVFATRDRTGVLILLSDLERQVVILGDQGIHAHMPNDGWSAHVATIVRAIHAGKGGDGVCQVIDALGEKLAELSPARPDDANELPNQVR
jgi:putative membrane protein